MAKKKACRREDISNTAVALLLILTVLVSIVGTWSVLESVNSVQIPQEQAPAAGDNVGRVLIHVSPLADPFDAAKQP